eukprot:g20586.t1
MRIRMRNRFIRKEHSGFSKERGERPGMRQGNNQPDSSEQFSFFSITYTFLNFLATILLLSLVTKFRRFILSFFGVIGFRSTSSLWLKCPIHSRCKADDLISMAKWQAALSEPVETCRFTGSPQPPTATFTSSQVVIIGGSVYQYYHWHQMTSSLR